jgi:REP element-mobilizing transposase RayT
LPASSPTHAARDAHDSRRPVHVTLRARSDVPSLRSERIFSTLARAIGRSNRRSFRIIHFSVQGDHVHFIVEGDSSASLIKGCHGLAIRCAVAVNRVGKRRGPVWAHRYHARSLATPREVRRGIAYVLLNFQKHLGAGPGIDPRSSGLWFDGWKRPPALPESSGIVVAPRTWLASVGWRRAGGPLAFEEGPGQTGLGRRT